MSATRITKHDFPSAGWSTIEYSANSKRYQSFVPKWHYYLRRKKRFSQENEVYEGVCHDAGNLFPEVDRWPLSQKPTGQVCKKCLRWVSRHVVNEEGRLP